MSERQGLAAAAQTVNGGCSRGLRRERKVGQPWSRGTGLGAIEEVGHDPLYRPGCHSAHPSQAQQHLSLVRAGPELRLGRGAHRLRVGGGCHTTGG